MMDYFEYIDDYKNGLLKGDLLQQFEKELAINESLQQAVEDHDVTAMALDLLLEEDIRSVMNEENSAVEEDQKMMGIKSYLIFMLVALVIGAIGYNYNKVQNKYSHENILMAYYEPLISDNITRASRSTFASKLEEGIYYYEMRRFDQSKAAFILSNQNEDIENLYLGNIYLIQGQLDSAELSLLKTSDPRALDALSIVYFENGNFEKLSELKKLSEKAQVLYDQIDSWEYKIKD